MWLIHLLPDGILTWFVNIFLAIGIIATLVSFFVTILPLLDKYRLPAQVLSVILLTMGVYFKGGYEIETTWRAKVAELEAKIQVAEQASHQTTVQVETKIVEKIKYVDRVKWKTKTVIKEVEKVIDAECKVVPDALNILNSSARDKVPTPVVTGEIK